MHIFARDADGQPSAVSIPLTPSFLEVMFGSKNIIYVTTGSFSISRDEMDAFSRLTGDNNPLHFDEKLAAQGIFGTIVVPGRLVVDLLVGYLVRKNIFRLPVLLGERVSYRAPLYPEELFYFRIQVFNTKPIKPSCSIVTFSYEACTLERGAAFQGEIDLLIQR